MYSMYFSFYKPLMTIMYLTFILLPINLSNVLQFMVCEMEIFLWLADTPSSLEICGLYI
jgi:hypothetical protein